MKCRQLIRNEDFLKNLSENQIEKLITLKEPIPMRINSMLVDYIPDFNLKRGSFIGDDEDFTNKIHEERHIARKLPPGEKGEYHNDLALKFIENHPEFASIIKEIKFIEV